MPHTLEDAHAHERALRRMATQIAVQLPEQPGDALRVLSYARDLVAFAEGGDVTSDDGLSSSEMYGADRARRRLS